MMRRAGIRPQPQGTVGLRPGTPFTRGGGFVLLGGDTELLGLSSHATPTGNIVAKNVFGERAWRREAASLSEKTTYLSLGNHAGKTILNGYTVVVRYLAEPGVYNAQFFTSHYFSTDVSADNAFTFNVPGNVTYTRMTQHFGGRATNGADGTGRNNQWRTWVGILGRNPPGNTSQGTINFDGYTDGAKTHSYKHPAISATWGLADLVTLGWGWWANQSTVSGTTRLNSAISLIGVTPYLLDHNEAQGLSADPYGYLFGDRRIWVPVSVAGGGPALSLPGVQSITTTSAQPKVTLTFS